MHSCIFNIDAPPKWEVFNLPPKTNVLYSVVFNQKRNFQQSVGKLTKEHNLCKMSSCYIVDNDMHSSMNSKNMDVIFFDGSEHCVCSCLSLRLFFHQQLLMKKLKKVFVTLNKLKKGGMYKLQNTCIYIKCIDGLKWALYYDLFEFLVKRAGKSIIGTLFYIHFAYKDLIFKELCFLRSINKNAVYLSLKYTNNFEAEKKNSKEVKDLSKRPFGTKDCSGHKFKVAKTEVLDKKRKHIDLDPDKKCKLLKQNHKFSKKNCRCRENKWHFYKSLVKCAVHSYTDILDAKDILNELKTTLNSSLEASICSNKVFKAVSAEVTENVLIPFPLMETNTLSNLTKVPLMWKKYQMIEANKYVHNYTPKKCINEESTNPKNDILLDSIDDLGNIQNNYIKYISDNTNQKNVMKQGNVNSNMFSQNKCYENNSFMTFQTASGKPLNISDEALQSAQKMYKEVCSQVKIGATKSEPDSSFGKLQEKARERDYNYQNSGFPCASKSILGKEYIDNIDNALDDKFFEEIPFDEKVDCKPYNQPDQSSLGKLNTALKSQSGKVKKSLGGRRSLKPYIKKVS